MRPPVFVEGELPDDNVRTMNPPPLTRRKEPEVEMQPSAPSAPPPGTGITPTPVRTSGTNPLIGESRTIREAPVAIEPERETTRQTRISGPSFLGLSDGPVSPEYLLEEDAQEERSMGRSYLFLGLLLLFGVLIYKQWGAVAAFGRDLAHNTMPSAETSESQATTPAVRPPADESAAAIPQKAEEKPESDHASATEEAAPSTTPQATEEDAIKQETAPPEPKAPARGKSSASSVAAPVYDDSQIELAQKYLQGRGVAQDCSRGVSLLRSAAAQPNPKAQIKLGALYATGHCVSQDRAEAYRWFAQAHELQPSNQWIDKNLNSLWSEMTAEERARAQR